MPKSTNRQAELRELLEQLNLGGMAAIFAEVALRAAKEHLTHEAYLKASESCEMRKSWTLMSMPATLAPAQKAFSRPQKLIGLTTSGNSARLNCASCDTPPAVCHTGS
ncbi:hypothetical protein KSC_017230 [Ktedonobacter sp. SOSP1-52]|uniref:hypothetical protein n=1 Tax=Ktedonobacter sp. SOSP1-52 TaxID=2778366 RepID=UPI0019167BDE|nr:hypothetical protein [Ktedonobacter sp. SOSP1-52]GHO62831.1 hypothetical protein KSC_017230 [Ktedonobacter sp. SOSP1-52]